MVQKGKGKEEREGKKRGEGEEGKEKKHSSRQKNYLITPRPGIEPGSSA